MKKKFNEILNQNVENNNNTLNEKVYVFDYEDDPQMKNASELTDYMRRMYGYSSMYNLSQKELRQRELNDKKLDYQMDRSNKSRDMQFELDKRNLDWQLDMRKEINRHDEEVNNAILANAKDQRDYNVKMNKNRLDYNKDTLNKWQDYLMNRDRYSSSDYQADLNYRNARYKNQLDFNIDLQDKDIQRYKAESERLNNALQREIKVIETEAQKAIARSRDRASVKIAEAKRDSDIKSAELAKQAQEAKLLPTKYQHEANELYKTQTNYIRTIYSKLASTSGRGSLNDPNGTIKGSPSARRVLDGFLKTNKLDILNSFYANCLNGVQQEVTINGNRMLVDFDTENGEYIKNMGIPFCAEDIKEFEYQFDQQVPAMINTNAEFKNFNDGKFETGGAFAYLQFIAANGITPKFQEMTITGIGSGNERKRQKKSKKSRNTNESYDLTSEYEKNLIFGNILENISDVVSLSEADLSNVNKNLVSAAGKVASSANANPGEKALLVNAALGQIRKNDSKIKDKDPLVNNNLTEDNGQILAMQRQIENDRKQLDNKVENNNKIEDIARENIEKKQESLKRMKELNKAVSTEANGDVAKNQDLSK